MNTLTLKTGRDKAVLRHHPWIFSGAVQSISGEPEPGETVTIRDSNGQFLAWAAYSPKSQIRARIWSWDEDQVIDPSFFEGRIRAAINLRQTFIDQQTTSAYRLIHAESDNLPGLIVDRYNDVLVMQILSAGIERWQEDILQVLIELIKPEGIYERSDVAVRELEGLEEKVGDLYGKTPQRPVLINENGIKFKVDLVGGQKTGFYLDQRDNRQFCREIAKDKSVLNCFAYTGGFTAYTLAGGAESVLSIDSSEDAIHLAKENVLLNQGSLENCEWIVGDVFEELRTLRDRGRQFDLVILDPPKFAPTASQARQAARGYKDINLYGFKLLKPGGTLMTFSCSGGIDETFFQKIVADAALDAGEDAQILYRLSQSPDHPTHLAFPEGTYLKGLVVRIVD
ncbi:MAG: class I SAM-dependent rRNA methyltransferase [Chloroflexota bacterium]|nr:class I SAM-dependent rRNA methyltransferase [Chloroflexota bacterium]